MTAVTVPPGARCAACSAAEGLYNRGDGIFCVNRNACRYRMAAYGDPVAAVADITIPSGRPPAVPGATCSVCDATDPPGGVFRRAANMFACLDRPGCDERAIEFQYLQAWSDESPDQVIVAADMRRMAAHAGAQIPPERTELDHTEMASLAAQERLGGKR